MRWGVLHREPETLVPGCLHPSCHAFKEFCLFTEDLSVLCDRVIAYCTSLDDLVFIVEVLENWLGL